jgi:hypothetical protein
MLGEVLVSALPFHGETGENLLLTKGATPMNFSTQDSVMRLACFCQLPTLA